MDMYFRSLRDQWETVCDQLSETQRKLESDLFLWSNYDENYEQLQKWLLDTEVQLNEDTDMKATLPDKKAQLQNHRVCTCIISVSKHFTHMSDEDTVICYKLHFWLLKLHTLTPMIVLNIYYSKGQICHKETVVFHKNQSRFHFYSCLFELFLFVLYI
jgi:hypothetical protein